MRQVFTSQRLETVEGVAELLEQAGIAVHVSHARSYRSRRSGQFSYSDPTPAHQQPAVWVRRAEDQPRARELLREAGLMATTRTCSGLPQTTAEALPMPSPEDGGRRWTWRIRIGLLLVIAAVAMLVWIGRRQPPTPAPALAPAPAAAPAPASADQEPGEEVIRIRLSPPPPDPPRR